MSRTLRHAGAPPSRPLVALATLVALAILVALATLALLLAGSAARAGSPQEPSNPAISFKRDVAPLLLGRCQGCHGPEKVKGGFRLDSFAELMKPGASKAAPVTPGRPDESELYRLVVTGDDDDRMPKKGDRLGEAQVRLLRQWIEQGAKDDAPDPATPLAALAADAPFPDPPAVYRRPVPVTALAFSPDGKELAVGGYHEVTVWSADHAVLLRRLKNLPQRVCAVAWSPDGALLAVAGGTPGALGEVRLIDAATGTRPRVLDRTADLMFAARFSPDGSRLAAGGADNAVRVYDLAGGAGGATTGPATLPAASLPAGGRRLLIEQHADWVTDLAFSPDALRLASASRDKSCRVFDARTGLAQAAYLEHDEPVFAVAWSADGQAVYSAGKGGKVHAWSPGDGKKLFEVGGMNADVARLSASAGMLYSACSDGRVRQHSAGNPPAWVRDFVLCPDRAYAVAVNEKARRLAAGGFDGQVKVWSLDGGKELSAFIAAPGFDKQR